MLSFILIFACFCIQAKADSDKERSLSKSLDPKEIGKRISKSKNNILQNNEKENDSLYIASDVLPNKEENKDTNHLSKSLSQKENENNSPNDISESSSVNENENDATDSVSEISSDNDQKYDSDISSSNNEKDDDSSFSTESEQFSDQSSDENNNDNTNTITEDDSYVPDPIVPSFDDNYFPNLYPFKPNYKVLPHVEMRIKDDISINCLDLIELVKSCKENPKEYECWRVTNIDDLICINDTAKINDELAKIDTNYDLHIETRVNISSIDLSQIKHPIKVFIKKDTYNVVVGLAGLNESKITTLVLDSLTIDVKDHPLKIDNTVLRSTTMASNSEPIISKNMDLDSSSASKIGFEKLQFDHISFTIPYFDHRYFRVFINESEWNILYRRRNEENFEPLFTFPYNLSETLNLNVEAIYIDFYIENEAITTLKDVNLAIFSPRFNSGEYQFTENPYDKNIVKLTSSGNWKSITDAIINITYYDEFVELENYLYSKVKLIDNPIYIPKDPEVSSSEDIKDDPNAYPEDHPFQPESYPKRKPFTNIYISSPTFACSFYKNFVKKCKENPNDEECIDFDEDELPEEVICLSSAKNINSEIANLNNNNDLLISTDTNIPDIDLNQLKSKKSVTFESLEPADYDFRNNVKNIKKRNRLLKKKPKENVVVDNLEIEIGIRGNIQEKVSSLILISESDEYSKTPKFVLKILEAPLTIDYLELQNSFISFETELIKPKRMTIDPGTYLYMFAETWSFIQVKHFSLYIPYTETDELMYRITFLENKWDVSLAFFNDPQQSYYSRYAFPYSSCGRFNLMTVSHFFDLHADKGNSIARPINITLLSLEKQKNEHARLLDDSKYLVKLTSSGDWDDINTNVSVYFTGFQDYLNIDNQINSTKVTFSNYSLHEDGTVTPPAPDDDEIPVIGTVYQPPFSTFTFSSQLIVTNDNSMCSAIKTTFEKCKENPIEEYCEAFDSIDYYGCTTPQNINNELQNLPSNSHTLAIMTLVDIPDIDFNKLKNKISIFLSYTDDSSDLKLLSQKEGIKKKILRKKVATANIGIHGNIKDKVSFLRLQKITIKVSESPLNIENMLLITSYIDSSSQQLQCQNLIVDGVTHENIISSSSDKIKVTQYGIKDYQESADSSKYRISFGKDRWTIFQSSILIEYYWDYFPKLKNYPDLDQSTVDEIYPEDYPMDAPDYIPYSFAERFTFIIPSHYFDLFVENDTTIAKPLNLTIMNLDSLLLEDPKYNVKLTTSGNWDNINDSVSIYFTSFKSFVVLDTKSCNSKIEVTRHDAFNPIIIIDSTSKDEKEAGKADLSEVGSDKIKEELDKHFDKTDDGDQFVSISDNKETAFTDLNLAPNQYIKLEDNAKVTLSGGNLNLFLNEDSSSVSINVSDNNDVKLSIKNKVESTVNIETKSESVSINSNSEVYSPLKLTVSENVKTIKIESINLHDSGSISATRNDDPSDTVPITVNNLQAQAQTSGKLTKVKISSEFSITETASLELENVELEGTKLNLNLHSYNYANYIFPMLHGTLGKPPSSIELNKPSNGKTQPSSQDKDKQFLIFQGTFTSTCASWKDALNFSDTFFNNAECENYSPALEESRSLVINRVNEETKTPPEEEKKNNGDKLSKGQIAGIVVGVIAGVAIIAIIITVVVIKKKKKENSADESDKVQVDL